MSQSISNVAGSSEVNNNNNNDSGKNVYAVSDADSDVSVGNKDEAKDGGDTYACHIGEKYKEKNTSDLLSSPQTRACFVCQEKDLAAEEEEIDDAKPDCKICTNIRLYHSKNELQQKAKDSTVLANEEGNNNEDEIVHISFPGPGIVRRNHIYGNYVVASRTIEAGELIICEKPLTIAPYGPPDVLPLCLSCSRDIGLSSRSKCSKCRWPVCDEECEKFHLHADNECSILAKNGIKSRTELCEYFSIETLRTLLLRDKDPRAWKRILDFEPHIEARADDYKARAATEFIVDFIRNRCQLADEFDANIIDHVVGVLSVNSFWAFRDLNRYASCLFDKITLFAHDCDPNTVRKFVLVGDNVDKDAQVDNFCENETNLNPHKGSASMQRIALKVCASRRIQAGEMISIRYINLNQSLLERREELRETFYFDCTCSRCLSEMLECQTKTTDISNTSISSI